MHSDGGTLQGDFPLCNAAFSLNKAMLRRIGSYPAVKAPNHQSCSDKHQSQAFARTRPDVRQTCQPRYVRPHMV